MSWQSRSSVRRSSNSESGGIPSSTDRVVVKAEGVDAISNGRGVRNMNLEIRAGELVGVRRHRGFWTARVTPSALSATGDCSR